MENTIYKCNVCGNTHNNSLYIAKEMMFGYRDEFKYFKCAECECLQISEIPVNLSKYYSNYYSFNTTSKKKLRQNIMTLIYANPVTTWLGKLLIEKIALRYNKVYSSSPLYWFKNNYCNFNSKILDVGCGGGFLLLLLNDYGFKHLKGVDLFIEKDLNYKNVNIKKGDVYSIEEQFDFIMLHHSFEHMSEPSKVLNKLTSLISKNGTILIRIPLVDCYAWRKYGVHWAGLDAPRHLFLHTVKSISILSEKNGLKIDKIVYDSNDFQFSASDKYLRDIPLEDNINIHTKQEIKYYEKKARELNLLKDGERACFFLKKMD